MKSPLYDWHAQAEAKLADFGGWDMPKTCATRYYISEIAPKWFKRFYLKYGEGIAKFIHKRVWLKIMLRPLFEIFALIGNIVMERKLKCLLLMLGFQMKI